MNKFLQFLGLSLAYCLSATSYADKGLSLPPYSIKFVKQDSEPKYFESNSEGLCGEFYQLLIAKLEEQGFEASIDPVNYPIKRILGMLENGEVDAFCGAGRTEAREKLYAYSQLPVYSVSNVVSAKADAQLDIKSFDDIVNQHLVVGALFGTSSSTWLKSHEGMRINDKFHTLEEGLSTLANNPDIDLFFYHDLGLNYLSKSLGLPIKVLPVKFRTIDQWVIYSPQTPEHIVQVIETAMKQLETTGTLRELQHRYLVDDK